MPPMSLATIMVVGAIIVSALNSISFFIALVMAYMSKDAANLELLIGAVIANMSTVVAYWLGSSAGSARKNELLAVAQPSQPPRPPANDRGPAHEAA